jgi:fused signal recognition particle receptor
LNESVFDYLANAGNHENSWILVYGPLVFFSVVIGILAVGIWFWRKREASKLESNFKDLKVSGSQESSTASTDVSKHREAEASVAAQEPLPAALKAPLETWAEKVRRGLARTRTALTGGLQSLFAVSTPLDPELLEKIHEHLYRADVGVKTSDRLVQKIAKAFQGQSVDWSLVKSALGQEIETIFSEAAVEEVLPETGPRIILVIGVNGVGKTTSIGKLALYFKSQGKSVMLCAADTFRAAAIEQLSVWADRNDVPIVKHQAGADPAAVAFDGVQAAVARKMDVLLIDTAGRLHSKADLMQELAKINRSITKGCPGAPHETWIVLDSTTGQNAVQQCKAFHEIAKLSGIVMTKLDGTAKGGVVIGISDQFKIPIRFLGVGEQAEDLREFNGKDFSDGLLAEP